jgi:hypothetical protein
LSAKALDATGTWLEAVV